MGKWTDKALDQLSFLSFSDTKFAKSSPSWVSTLKKSVWNHRKEEVLWILLKIDDEDMSEHNPMCVEKLRRGLTALYLDQLTPWRIKKQGSRRVSKESHVSVKLP